MRTAADVMHRPAPAVPPSLTVRELYDRLMADGLDGICVVEGDRLLGVVTSMDLVFRERNVHLPTFFTFMDAIIPTSDPRRTFEEVAKIAGRDVGSIATRKPVTVAPDATVATCASMMVDQHLSVLPVVDGDGTLLGMVTKQDVLRAAFEG